MSIVLGILLVILGISIGQIIGQWSMKPIINGYKEAIEGYREVIQLEREAREEMASEYEKLMDLLKGHYELG